MVLNANDLLGWKDFPKGLRVLLLEDQQTDSASETRLKLQEMDYIVSTFYNEAEALSAIFNSAEGFHVALVEVSTDNSDGRIKFLQAARDLPTIMTSDMHCLDTMMKCIALGAVEFLRKPLSEEKIRNIWQHVVHKAFNAGGKDISEPLKPLIGNVTSASQLCFENGESNHQLSVKAEYENQNHELTTGSDKYPAPSTPQIKGGMRLVDDGDCLDQTNIIEDKERMEPDAESKSVEITIGDTVAETILNNNTVAEGAVQTSPPQGSGDGDNRPQHQLANDIKDKSNESSSSLNRGGPTSTSIVAKTHGKSSKLHNICGSKANRKKMKVDWTSELHKKFVQAVEKLGVDQAIPSKILEVMKVEGLTRHNIASHLQKYRMQQRHILPKERNHNSRKPVVCFPSYHNTHIIPSGQGYQGWLPPSTYPAGLQMWGSPYYPPWPTAENWHWTPYPAMQADAWGCPVMPPPPMGPCSPFPQSAPQCQSSDYLNISQMPKNMFDLSPAEEVIDKVVKEAISKPWLPLPLGLKPPSTDSVLNELSRQGISSVPPHAQGPLSH